MGNKKIYLKKPEEADIVVLSGGEFARDIFTFTIKKDKNTGVKHISLGGLYRKGIIKLLSELGYYKRYHDNNIYDFIRDLNNILDIVEPCIMKDDILEKIKSNYKSALVFEYKDTKVEIEAPKLHEIFLKQSHLIFNDTFLEHLPNHIKPILKDTQTEAFFPFKNKIVKVMADQIATLEYSELDKVCIWRKHILKRNYTEPESLECHFHNFIQNICNKEDERIESIATAMGYLLHNYSFPSNGQAVIAYDEEITDIKNPMGGTGKGIIQQAIGQLRNVVKIDGKGFDEKDKFCFQNVDERTQVVFFDDVRADLGFDRFNSILTEGWTIEKKMKQSFFIPPEESPKVYITSNAIIQGDGITAQRRQFIIELAPFYSNLIRQKLEPIRHVHGCIFFGSDWNEKEWNSFYKYMLECVKYYLSVGLKYCKPCGVSANKLRQGTSEDFYEWITEYKSETEKEYDLQELFCDFRNTYYGENSDFHRRTFTNWLKTYALTNELEIKIKRSNGMTKVKFQCTSAQETITNGYIP